MKSDACASPFGLLCEIHYVVKKRFSFVLDALIDYSRKCFIEKVANEGAGGYTACVYNVRPCDDQITQLIWLSLFENLIKYLQQLVCHLRSIGAALRVSQCICFFQIA